VDCTLIPITGGPCCLPQSTCMSTMRGRGRLARRASRFRWFLPRPSGPAMGRLLPPRGNSVSVAAITIVYYGAIERTLRFQSSCRRPAPDDWRQDFGSSGRGLGRTGDRDAVPIACYRFVAPSTMARSVPPMDRNFSRLTIHPRRLR
jgi:hypothetical protein